MELKEKCEELKKIYERVFGEGNVTYNIENNSCKITIKFNKDILDRELEALKKL